MNLGNLRRIAVLRNDRFGDLVCTLPVFEALRLGCPNAHLTAIVSSETGSAAALPGPAVRRSESATPPPIRPDVRRRALLQPATSELFKLV